MSTDPTVLVAGRYAQGATVSAVVIAAFWHTGFDLLATVANWSVYPRPYLAAGAWLGYLAIGAAGAVALLRNDLPPRSAWPLAVAALAVDGLMVAASPPAEVLPPTNWAWGSVGWLAVILFWRFRLVHLLAFLGANAALMLTGMAAAGLWDRIHLARAVMVLLGAVTLQIGYSVTAHGLSVAARWAAESSAARARAAARQAAAAAVHADRAERYHAVRHTTAALLGELAAGADPEDPDIQRRAAAAAARLRRLLAETDDVPVPLVHELRAGADVVERRGVLVSLRAVGVIPELPVTIRRALSEAPVEVLSGARTAARVTVVAGAGEVAVSVLADTAEPAQIDHSHPDVHVTQTREGNQLWIETRWRGPSPSPSSRTIPSPSTDSEPGSTATRHAVPR